MRGIDRYAWSNAIASIDPLQKTSLAGVAIFLCLALNDFMVSIVTAVWMAGATLIWARIPLHVVVRVALSEFFFLSLSTLGLIVTVGAAPAEPVWFSQPLGSLWVYTSQATVIQAGRLLMRALGCATAMSFLALTTPLVDLIEMLRRLHAPELLIDLLTISYRSVFVLLESIERIYLTQDSRLGYRNAIRAFVSVGGLGSQIFLETYRRSQRLTLALESRGHAGGALQVLPAIYRHTPMPWWIVALLAATLLAVYLFG